MRFAELFAGAGGLSLGLEQAGHTCVWHCEIEKHARAVLRHRWPDVPLYGDVSQLDGRELVARHGPIDLLSGGSPCQDLSVAGKRAGLGGQRSGLFYEQARLWRETEAPLLLWENVPGALSSNGGADFQLILEELSGTDCARPNDGWPTAGVISGPDGRARVAYRILGLQWFGPPQRRRRVFLLAVADHAVHQYDPAALLFADAAGGGIGTPYRPEIHAVSQSVSGHPAAGGTAGEGSAGAAAGCAFGFDPVNVTSKANRTRMVPGLSPTVHQRGMAVGFNWQIGGGYGNAHDGLAITEDGTGPLSSSQVPAVAWLDGREVAPTLDQSQLVKGQMMPEKDRFPVVMGRQDAWCIKGAVIGRADTAGPQRSMVAEDAFTLQTNEVHAVLAVDDECNASADMIGTLPSRSQSGVSYRQSVVAPTPRRLTPTECERLMGWPDGHTATGTRADGTKYALSDSARYRLCGNGVGSPCTRWIGQVIAGRDITR